MSESTRTPSVFSLLESIGMRSGSSQSSGMPDLGFLRGSGSDRKGSPERLRPIRPNPGRGEDDTIRDDDTLDPLRSILSFGDSDDSDDSDDSNKTEEILRTRPGANTRSTRSLGFESLLLGLLDPGAKRAREKGPQFPGVTERSAEKTKSEDPSGLKDFQELLDALEGAFGGNKKDRGELTKALRGGPVEWEPLHYAAQKGSLKICRAILDKGGNVDPRDDTNRTPLHYAAQQGHVELCRLLIERGADVNAGSDKGVTPLLLAGLKGNIEVLNLLLSHGADIEARVPDGSTLLILATWMGSKEKKDALYEVAQTLLEAGCDANAVDEDGLTALIAAALWNGVQFAKLLLAHGANHNVRDDKGRSALLAAASENDPDMLRLLLEHGADASVIGNRKWNALQMAVQHDNENALEVAQMLLDTGAIDVNAREERGATALYLSVQAGRVDVAEALLNAGADVNAVTSTDMGILERAVVNRNLPMMKMLHRHGANVNAVDKNGRSLLHVAVALGDEDAVRWLLEAGIDTELKTTDGRGIRAMQLAVQQDNDEIAMLLLDFGAK